MIAPQHILGSFDGALRALRNNVLAMAGLAERSLEHALIGLAQRNDDLCVATIADDEQIDQLEKQIDNEGVELLYRFQPLASDFRRVVSAMKLSSNLERVADMSVNIARIARKLNRHPVLHEVELIGPLRDQALAMFNDSVEAFVREDDRLARSLAARDKKLDEMNAEIGDKLIERMAENPPELRGYLNLLFVARNLERVGDHATNIAEDAVYVVAGEDIRHEHKRPPINPRLENGWTDAGRL